MTGYQSKKAAAQDKLAQPEQEPVAYDKTELNCFAQDLYDQKMREGKHGHYESMFHVIHQCVKKVASPPAQRKWVGLTDAEKDGKRLLENGLLFNAAEVQAWELGVEYAESILKEKNNG